MPAIPPLCRATDRVQGEDHLVGMLARQPLESAICAGAWIAVTLLMGDGILTPPPPVGKEDVSKGEYLYR